MSSKDHNKPVSLSPFANVNAQQNMSRNINRSSTMIDLKSTKSMTLDELRNALDGIAEDYGSAFTQRKFKREAGRAWTRNDQKETTSFETLMNSSLCSVVCATQQNGNANEYSSDTDLDTDADNGDISYCNKGGKKSRVWKETIASTSGKKRSIDEDV